MNIKLQFDMYQGFGKELEFKTYLYEVGDTEPRLLTWLVR